MHALSITFDNPDTITTNCVAMLEGQEQPAHPTTLKRMKEKSDQINTQGFIH